MFEDPPATVAQSAAEKLCPRAWSHDVTETVGQGSSRAWVALLSEGPGWGALASPRQGWAPGPRDTAPWSEQPPLASTMLFI